MFDDPVVQMALDRYEARRTADIAKMAMLGRERGMAVRDEFLLPVGPEVGWLIHALVIGRQPPRILELGTSYGYSTLFLADAARAVGGQVVSMDVAGYKQDFARAELASAGLDGFVEFRCGDAVAMTAADSGSFDLVLIDIWKELYVACFDAVLPKLAPGGAILADNMLRPEHDRAHADAYRAAVAAAPQLSSVLLDIGSGVELSINSRR
ncbi:O-methyltransferase [Sphingomonas sp. SUN039]|uniref:O-methyltransferase n=1 Tax=Sphingomonas sp. SUN039 TaxID=2937787 RepID=UPI002164A55F|nr:class I SAM-dependent methyltransferase [Sphingomonas sp. SUN039]UVO54361.1 class I SAM-dependent methyltransferase [Sphingomonas sp. SUN039]